MTWNGPNPDSGITQVPVSLRGAWNGPNPGADVTYVSSHSWANPNPRFYLGGSLTERV